MRILRLLSLTVFLLFSQILFSQTKRIDAVKSNTSPKIDGVLNDDAWQQAPVATDFVQFSPAFGQPVSVKSAVKILYDNSSVYIGAHLYDNPALMRKQITSRDGEQRQDVDYFAVFFDTYNDQQNGFQFLVTPSNVQTDTKLNAGANITFGDYGDRTWDAVWESKVTIVEDGWIVEMRIPYISLRFPKKDVQTWGLQFLRFTRRNNETSYWNSVNPNENGFINQFGKYENLRDIKPPLRLSFSPYVTGGIRYNPEGSSTDREVLRNGGMDVKYGINESFTLDATLIPDFGQVISDNVINNLSPFEIRFQENRPFFTEGTEIFNKAGLFYSRRIGAVPGDYYNVQRLVNQQSDYEIIRNPSITQLYNAIKFSGRTQGKLGIGIFNAVTAPMDAELRLRSTGRDTIIRTEHLTNYNIIVLDQALKNRSSITLTNTNVSRRGESRDANVSSFDWSFFTKDNNFRLWGTARYSKIFSYTPYTGNINLIEDTITRNGQLFVKPYDGFSSTLRVGKVSGVLQFSGGTTVESHKYDPNDLGFLQVPNKIVHDVSVSHNQLTATDKFNLSRYSLNAKFSNQYLNNAFSSVEYWATAFWWFKNFWDVSINLGWQPKGTEDYFELRTPERYLKRPSAYYVSMRGSSDSRKRLFVSFTAGYNKADIENGNYYIGGLGFRYRFSNNFSLSLDMTREEYQNDIGFAFIREPNGEPVIGYRKNISTTSILSGIYNFTPRLNLTLRTRHYWNNVNYNQFFNVAMDGSHIPRAFISGRDDNFNLFNTDAFLTWDFRLGSRIIMGWKNWIGNPYGVSNGTNYIQNLKGVFNTNHGNELTLKVIYFLDYNELRKKQ